MYVAVIIAMYHASVLKLGFLVFFQLLQFVHIIYPVASYGPLTIGASAANNIFFRLKLMVAVYKTLHSTH